ncbi:MAG TPA: hypothetical protein VGO91_05820 [Pyrinomonadaceae bacterium]|nr:hypothetical protein [Pyrinomonadaceae bacterium]
MNASFIISQGKLKHYRSFYFLMIVFVLAAGPILAQPQGPRGKTTPPIVGPTAQRKEEALQARRAQAVTLLLETADKALDVEDLFYRARILSLVADTLWPYEPERARQIFRRAWEAAAASDKAEREADDAESGLPSDPNAEQFTEARREVLKKAATRDPVLAEAFLKDLKTEKDDETGHDNNQSSRSTPWRELSINGARRLALATDLLHQGAPEKAFKFAAPLINEGVSASLILFILQMQEQDAAAADTLYRLLIERSRNETRADINAVLLLSSPIISPDMLVVIDERGSLQYRPVASAQTRKRAPLSMDTRAAFYDFAAMVLLRPRATATASNNSGRDTEAAAIYFATGRLLPFFEHEAAQYATELRARLQSLGDEMEASRRARLSNQMEVRSGPTEQHGDPLGPETDQLARAHDAATRDAVLVEMAMKAARQRLWDRARRAAADIENADERRAMQTFIVVNQIADITRAYTEDHETNLESLTKFINKADAPPFAKAWGLAQAATVAARLKNDGPTVLLLLNQAEQEAALTDQGRGTHQRIAAYIAVTGTAAQLAHGRAWELMAETVKAINATEDYTGDEDSLELITSTTLTDGGALLEGAKHLSLDAGIFRLDKIFATMARLDFDKALMNARDLDGDVPQAFAIIATARAALEQNRSQEPGVRSQKKSD